jgi:AraC-like DNA-binding protein
MNLEQEALTSIVCWKHAMGYRTGAPLHKHLYSEFYLCVEETGHQVTPSGREPMVPGDLFYFPPGQLHHGNGSPEKVGVGVVLYLPENALSPIHVGDRETRRILDLLAELAGRTNCRIPLSPAGSRAVTEDLLAIADEMRLARPAFHLAVKSRLQNALLTLLRDPATPGDIVREFARPTHERRLQNVRTYMETHFYEAITIDQLVAMTHFGHSQFHAVFKQEMGCTCTQYLNRLRLQHAAKLIRETRQSMTDIAYDCGFPCLSHFYHVFRSHYGMSPRQMRRAGY